LAFNRRLREEINRSARSRQSLAVLLIDLDYFKQITEQFGHAAGDAVLSLIGDSLRACVRSYDFVARFGGDEFAIICHDCQPENIGLPIMRLQRALASRLEADSDLSLSVT